MLRQRHFRFRTDTGAVDATPTWGAAEDANYVPGSAAFRLRFSIENPDAEATGSLPFQIYVSKNGGAYAAVTTSSTNGIKSIDAGSDADNTTIVIPRLTTPVWTPLSGAAIDLDFQRRRYYSSSSLADIAPTSVLSISRASTGYAKTAAGTLTSFGTGTLRITDLGLLIEDARTNVCFASQTLANASFWQIADVANLTITDNQTVAPDGTTTADKNLIIATGTRAVFNAVGGGNGSVSPGTSPLTVSAYFKLGSGAPWTELELSDGTNAFRSFFNISTGAVGSNSISGNGVLDSANVETLANGWFRCSVTGHVSSGAGSSFSPAIFSCCTTNGGTAVTLNDFQYVWGVQTELGAFASSYIPTTTTAATRAADAIFCTGAADTILSALPYSVVMDLTAAVSPVVGGAMGFIGDNNTGNNYPFYASGDGNSNLRVQSIVPSGSLFANFPGGILFSTGVRCGQAMATGARSVVGGGGTVVTDANSLAMTSGAVKTSPWVNIRRLTVWNSKLADATLQALTAP